ncbi:hypothetical protein KQY30_33675 [Streptomyces sp. GMY02]|uniref:hypothetical protein n=1 Tax=Streptomyces sp. GMY02 TaxID=1333528 RepID=UPI001C2CA1B3|nr:hypothetical protein [Streptomyces sp. GMY02]QXE38450.1 hypothetical protein KQY30_33675 [Streptomyces sp. GMY02]
MTDQTTADILGAAPQRPPFDAELIPVVKAYAAIMPRWSQESLAAYRQAGPRGCRERNRLI